MTKHGELVKIPELAEKESEHWTRSFISNFLLEIGVLESPYNEVDLSKHFISLVRDQPLLRAPNPGAIISAKNRRKKIAARIFFHLTLFLITMIKNNYYYRNFHSQGTKKKLVLFHSLPPTIM